MHPRISYKKVAVLTEEQALAMPVGYFDDNGGETDGWLYICAAEDAPEGAKIMNGFLVEGYTGQYVQANGQGGEFCGWSSRGYAYALDEEIADGIAREEEFDEHEQSIVAVERPVACDLSDWPELNEDEIFDCYATPANPLDLIQLSREQIAQQLVELDDLDEATARRYAQAILKVARRNIG